MSKRKLHEHHEIPKLYLKGFCESCSSSYIWVFGRGKPFNPGQKPGKHNPVKIGIRKTGHRKDAYAILEPGQSPNYWYENSLQKVEHKADATINMIRNREPINRLNKEVIAQYIVMMRLRLSTHDPIATQILEKIINSWDDSQRGLTLSDKSKKQLSSEPVKTILRRESMVSRHGPLETALLNMSWNFLVAAKDGYFVTSDNPVIYDERRGLGASELIFPFSQRVLLYAQWSQLTDLSYKDISAEETRRFNTVIIRYATKDVYSPKPDQWIHEVWETTS